MKILVTGAKGFVGKNLCAQLHNIKEGKARQYPVSVSDVFEYDLDSSPEELDRYCREADFVFNLAGVNRPQDPEDFKRGNYGFASKLLATLKLHSNRCPVMLASSVQASLQGRYAGHPYGESKKAGEDLFFAYGRETGARVIVYRFPNVFGKWCRPDYNSAVATFCHHAAHDLPVTVNDPSVELQLVYIDDLVEELISSLTGDEHYNGSFAEVPVTHKATLGEIYDILERFKSLPGGLAVPDLTPGGFEKKLYTTYMSYLPKEKAVCRLKMNTDSRGSFTELLHTSGAGQISVNISKPGVTKGEHWHHSKIEKFIVVKGRGLIRQRRIGSDEVLDFEVSGDCLEAVDTLPGYTHNIINLSDTEDLVTVMWCNETFDPGHPDTFHEAVEK